MTTITTTPVLYVVLARDRGPSGTSTTSLLIRALNDDGGAVLGCYLSPFDAMMDRVHRRYTTRIAKLHPVWRHQWRIQIDRILQT